jgi:lipopolysaccharide/colanic/teichoic acid biosynthesis glycosyltransferase
METAPSRLFVNLHKINDVRRLNEYFLTIHRTLLPGGCFVGYAHTIRTHHQWVYGKFPRQFAHLYYGIDFLLHRVIPKLPHINKLYFMITKGKNRVLSRAEVLGRFSFCGFDIVAEKEINKQYWVIARKVKHASFQKNPTFGPLVTLHRTGRNGQPVKVYKLRTMHPYSEFLQQYVFDRHGLQKGGKLKDDFRLTTWGKLFRKLWIDELPMLYNWLKGDLKVVGVRPLSRHYLSLYDAELRRMRMETKPGLLPPFYADLPATFDEICASEKRYLRAYFDRPIRTDIAYCFRALYNILIKRARSY